MAAPIKCFEGAAHARLYLKFRPIVPQKVFKRILEYLQEKSLKPFKLAVDVGCGPGQSTRPLTPHFEKVIGVDVSEAQVAAAVQQADNPPNVEYRTGRGEKIPVSDNSVSLVTCCQTVHWLDYMAFCTEVDRVLQPSGCISIFAYGNFIPETCDHDESKDKSLQQLYKNFYKGSMGPYWDKRRRHIDNLYADFSIPYAESIRDDSFQLVQEITVSSYVGYISSWSALRSFLEKNPGAPNPLNSFQERLLEILDVKTAAEQTKIRMKAPIVLLLGRKPPPSEEMTE